MALAFSFLLRFEFTLDAGYRHMLFESLPILVGVKLAVFRAFGLRDLAWRYLGFADLVRLAYVERGCLGCRYRGAAPDDRQRSFPDRFMCSIC